MLYEVITDTCHEAATPTAHNWLVKSEICEQYGIDFPLFAFSHCRDVVAAVTNAGGFGVLGGVAFTPDQLEQDVITSYSIHYTKLYEIGQLRRGQVLALALELGRHDDVHAVGLAVDVRIDPAQLLFELLRCECHPAEHAEPARIGDSYNFV